MTSEWKRVITAEYLKQFLKRKNENNSCKKCGKRFQIDEIMIRKKKSRGKSTPYHDSCFERIHL
jgi:hypothetical protein